MASPRDFVFDDQGEMLPSDSAAAAARRKELGTTPKPPTRPGQQVSGAKPAAKAKPAIVTKEELAKSGLSLRDYMNKQRGLTRRDGKAPEKAKPSTPAAKAQPAAQATPSATTAEQPKGKTASDYSRSSDAMRNLTRQKAAVTTFPSQVYDTDTDRMRNVSRAAAKDAGGKRGASASAKAPPPAEKRKALAISPGVLKQREADEKRRAERKEFGRQRDEKKKESFGMKKGGKVCMASKRADGIAVKGKTRGKVY